MKTIVIYSQNRSSNYEEFFAELLREGRRRDWRFAFVEPADIPFAEENARMGKILGVLKPAGFVGCCLIENRHIDLPRELPQVWLDCHWAPPGKPLVRHDNAAFGAAAARALLDGGDNYATFGIDWFSWSRQRTRAFAATLAAKGIKCRRIKLDVQLESQYMALDDICAALKKFKRPVSVFAATDKLAAIVLMAAESFGWHCPGDIRIVGVDDNEITCTASPTTLSSVHPDWADGARVTAEALVAQMRGERVRRLYLYGAAGVTRRASTRDAYRRPKDDRVNRGLAFVQSEFATPITVSDVVAKMACSRSLADRRFREETGKSILETIEDLRWERLQTLLVRKSADLRQMPRLLGFRTPAALRAFVRRRSGGRSMTALRASNAVVP